jgi:nucleotide-binding universal stress UspA family protein
MTKKVFPPANILFPTDFSDRSAAVAPMAAEFARHFDSDLTLLHVAPLFPEGSPEGRRLLMDAFAAIELRGLRTERIVLGSDNDPAGEIVAFAQRRRTDLIMMPTHGYGPFRRFLFGSATLKVLHDAACPVWTGVHVEQLPVFGNIAFRSVVCALDLSNKSCETLKWAAQFAKEYGARLTIAHAIPSPISAGAEYMYTDWREEMADSARMDFANLQKGLGTDAEVNIVSGETAYAVRQVAEKAHADLLVIGRSGADGFVGRLRTHAFPIIRQSPCPVVSV